MVKEKTITCYHGKVPKASGYDLMEFLYCPKDRIAILSSPKGTTIVANRVSEHSSDKDYLQGKRREVSEKIFNKTIDKCVELSELTSSTIDLFHSMI